jgi:hypothetical protein
MMNEGTCRHYTGLADVDDAKCGAGVCYYEAFDGTRPGIFLRMPCFQFTVRPAHGRGTYIRAGEPTITTPKDRRGEVEIHCPHLSLPSHEECEQERAKIDAHINKTMSAMPVIIEAKKRLAPGTADITECPICGGRLIVSVSRINGHVRASCETHDCVDVVE